MRRTEYLVGADAGRQVRRASVAAQPRLHARGRGHARARHRRDRGHLQRGARGRAAAAYGSAARSDSRRFTPTGAGRPGNVSAGNFVDGIEPVSAFDSVTAMQYSSFNLADDEDAERVIGARATAGFFDVFATAPLHGPRVHRDEDDPGTRAGRRPQPSVVDETLRSEPSIVGKSIRLNGRPYQVIGIMPAHFDFTAAERGALGPDRVHRGAQGDARRTLPADLRSAEAGCDRAAGACGTAEKCGRSAGCASRATTRSSRSPWAADGRDSSVITAGVCSSCSAPSASCCSSRAATSRTCCSRAGPPVGRAGDARRARRRTRTDRASTADRERGARLCRAEPPGWRSRGGASARSSPRRRPACRASSRRPSMPVVLAFTLGVALLSAACLAWRRRCAPHERTCRRSQGRRRGSAGPAAYVIACARVSSWRELALALMLLVGAGLLIRSALALERAAPGFDPTGVLAGRLALPASDYSERERIVQTFERIVEGGVARCPASTAAALTSQVPMGPGGNGNGLIPKGRPMHARTRSSRRLRIVTPGYFETLGIPIVRGRALTAADRRGGLKVMVISEALADAAFPGQDPIGKRIACCEHGPDGKSAGLQDRRRRRRRRALARPRGSAVS